MGHRAEASQVLEVVPRAPRLGFTRRAGVFAHLGPSFVGDHNAVAAP